MQWQELISCLVAIGVYRRLVLPFCLIYGAISIQRIQRSLGNTSHTSPSFRLGFSLSLSRQAISLRGLTERSLAHLINQSALALHCIDKHPCRRGKLPRALVIRCERCTGDYQYTLLTAVNRFLVCADLAPL